MRANKKMQRIEMSKGDTIRDLKIKVRFSSFPLLLFKRRIPIKRNRSQNVCPFQPSIRNYTTISKNSIRPRRWQN